MLELTRQNAKQTATTESIDTNFALVAGGQIDQPTLTNTSARKIQKNVFSRFAICRAIPMRLMMSVKAHSISMILIALDTGLALMSPTRSSGATMMSAGMAR